MFGLVNKIAASVQLKFAEEASGHDWWHINRVWQMARHIATHEKADLEVVELAALLHDIADWKFHDGDETVGPREARAMLEKEGAPLHVIDAVVEIIATLSFQGAEVPTPMSTIEGKIVQDADRLDALGAIGIARCFAYGGFAGRLIYDPNEEPVKHTSGEEYRQNKTASLNHFHEKLYLLRDRMNTETAKTIADDRHKFMEQFEARFKAEWARFC